MDIRSDPATIEVTDFEFYFLGGTNTSITLRPEDTLTESGIDLVIHTQAGERIVVERRNLLYSSRRTRTVPIKPQPSPQNPLAARAAALPSATDSSF